VAALPQQEALPDLVPGEGLRRVERPLTCSYDIAMLRAVRLTAAPDIVRWLGSHPQLEWDDGNSTKSLTKHGFRTADVGSILDAAVVFAGRIVEPAHAEARYLLLGVTSGGRHAALIFTRRGDRLRPISCRAMRKGEREVYDAAT